MAGRKHVRRRPGAGGQNGASDAAASTTRPEKGVAAGESVSENASEGASEGASAVAAPDAGRDTAPDASPDAATGAEATATPPEAGPKSLGDASTASSGETETADAATSDQSETSAAEEASSSSDKTPASTAPAGWANAPAAEQKLDYVTAGPSSEAAPQPNDPVPGPETENGSASAFGGGQGNGGGGDEPPSPPPAAEPGGQSATATAVLGGVRGATLGAALLFGGLSLTGAFDREPRPDPETVAELTAAQQSLAALKSELDRVKTDVQAAEQRNAVLVEANNEIAQAAAEAKARAAEASGEIAERDTENAKAIAALGTALRALKQALATAEAGAGAPGAGEAGTGGPEAGDADGPDAVETDADARSDAVETAASEDAAAETTTAETTTAETTTARAAAEPAAEVADASENAVSGADADATAAPEAGAADSPAANDEPDAGTAASEAASNATPSATSNATSNAATATETETGAAAEAETAGEPTAAEARGAADDASDESALSANANQDGADDTAKEAAAGAEPGPTAAATLDPIAAKPLDLRDAEAALTRSLPLLERSQSELVEAFRAARRAALADLAATPSAGAGFGERVSGFFGGLVVKTRLRPEPASDGEEPDNVMARAELAARNNDFAAALSALEDPDLNAIDPEHFRDWRARVEAQVETAAAEQALADALRAFRQALDVQTLAAAENAETAERRVDAARVGVIMALGRLDSALSRLKPSDVALLDAFRAARVEASSAAASGALSTLGGLITVSGTPADAAFDEAEGALAGGRLGDALAALAKPEVPDAAYQAPAMADWRRRVQSRIAVEKAVQDLRGAIDRARVDPEERP